MSNVSAVLAFIATVELHFPRPKFNGDEEREEQWVQSMVEALGGFAPATLARAASQVSIRRDPVKTSTTFPKPSECIKYCVESADFLRVQSAPSIPLLAKPKVDEWSDERLSLAFDLLKTAMGRRAAEEGWVQSLYYYCRKHGEVPRTEDDVQRCLNAAANQSRFLDEIKNVKPGDRFGAGPLRNELVKFAASFESEKQDLAKKVLGG